MTLAFFPAEWYFIVSRDETPGNLMKRLVTALKITELYDLSHTAAGDYLGKNCAGAESFTVGDVTVRGASGQSAMALAGALRQSAERLMEPYAASGAFCFKGVRG